LFQIGNIWKMAKNLLSRGQGEGVGDRARPSIVTTQILNLDPFPMFDEVFMPSGAGKSSLA
jgi:hypothetical protein